MVDYSNISIIYNPNSTGSSDKLTLELSEKLKTRLPDHKISLIPTQYAGHAEVLAYELAMASKKPLIISASGDGGYHELINGLMKAQGEGARPIAGLLPAGNANDHFRSLHNTDTLEAILSGEAHYIDLIKVETKKIRRYAHSYVGVGLTPAVGRELNKAKLNWLTERWIVFKVFVRLKPEQIEVQGEKLIYDSLIFSNISKMSKVLSVADKSLPDDGKFEVIRFAHRHKFKLISTLFRAWTVGLKTTEQASCFNFNTIHPSSIQMDGEISELREPTKVTVRSEKRVLNCII